MTPANPQAVFDWIGFEPADEVSRRVLERELQHYFPGAYQVVIRGDRLGFDMVFADPQEATVWTLRHGPVPGT